MSQREVLMLGGGVLAGAVVVGIISAVMMKKQQAASTQAPQLPAGTSPDQPVLVKSGQSLNNGWLYFLTLITPDSTTAQTAAQAVGFVDPNTKGAPVMASQGPLPDGTGTYFTSAATFSGVTGTFVPANTPSVRWVNVYGFPPPEGLATV